MSFSRQADREMSILAERKTKERKLKRIKQQVFVKERKVMKDERQPENLGNPVREDGGVAS